MRPVAFSLLLASLLAPLGAAAADPPGRPLTRDEALRTAAAQNLGLLVDALDIASAETAVDVAYGAYVPTLDVEGKVGHVPAPTGEPRTALTVSPTLVASSPLGTTLSAGATVREGLGGNPASERTLRVELTQALLRGGLALGSDTAVPLAKADVAIAKERYRDGLNRFLADVDAAYWELAFAREDRAIKRRSRDLAATQRDETQENIRRGLLAPGEIYIVEENLVDFEERLTRADEAVALAEVTLSRLLRAPAGPAPEPSSAIAAPPSPRPSDADSLVFARGHHPLIAAARLAVEQSDTRLGGERREAYPALDAFGALSRSEGTDTFGQVVDDSPALEAGLRLSIPLYWGPDAARVERARIARRQAGLSLEETTLSVETALKQAAIRLAARERRLELAATIVELSQKKLEVERDKYKSGLSTLADVVRFQRELDAALSASLRAKVDVLEARTALGAARGDLAETLGIEVR